MATFGEGSSTTKRRTGILILSTQDRESRRTEVDPASLMPTPASTEVRRQEPTETP
jgi:hypothetical protein